MLSSLSAVWPAAAATMLLTYLHASGDDQGAINARAFSATTANGPTFSEASPALDKPAMTIIKSADGLFYVDARINGTPVHFLVDTGANVVVLTPEDARRAGVTAPDQRQSSRLQTASGSSAMDRVKLATLSLAQLDASDIDAAVARSGLKVSLLGQNMLSKMASVSISGNEMSFRSKAN